MSFIGGGLEIGGPGDPSRFGSTRGRIGNSFAQGVNYPSPFFDIAHTYFPTSVKQLFRWCRYYFLTNGLVNTIIFKLSEYPVTDIVIDHPDRSVASRWTEYFNDQLNYKEFMVECGLDYFTYGIALPGIVFPLKKFLKCRTCGFREEARKIRPWWAFTNYEFRLTCPKCQSTGTADPQDVYFRNAAGVRMRRWSPEDIDIRTDEMTNATTYFYNVPGITRNDAILGKKDVVESIPQVIIQGMRQQKSVVLTEDLVFRMKRPSLAGQDRGYGTPLVLSSLKDLFYLQIMKKSQEAVLLERIVPLNVVFPQAGSATSDPYTSINLMEWRDHVATEIARWRRDCVSPESWIETSTGLVRADRVRVGDLVRNHQGGLSAVLEVNRRQLNPNERAYRINARGLSAITTIFSENHPIYGAKKVNNGNGHKLGLPQAIKVKDLRPGDYIGYPVTRRVTQNPIVDLASLSDRAATEQWVYVDHRSPEVPEAFEYLAHGGPVTPRAALLEEKSWSVNQYKIAQLAIREGRTLRRVQRYLPLNKDLAWALGLYAAEGNSSAKQVLFSLHLEETQIRARLDKIFAEHFGAAPGHTAIKTENGVQHVFSSAMAAEFFGGLCPGDSRTKAVPEIIKSAPRDLVAAYLAGYIEGDGCLHAENSGREKITAATASLQLAEGLRYLLLSCGIPAGVSYTPPEDYEIVGKSGRSHGSYRLGIYGEANTALRLLLEGKPHGRVDSATMGVFRDGYFWYRINAIENVECEEVIGFQTDSRESWLEVDGERHGTFCTWGMATANCNYIPILPLPIGTQTIGGDGKALLLTAEMQSMWDQIINQMQVPREFVVGGLSFSGSSVSMRMMENHFLGYIGRHRMMANWVLRSIANYMDWPVARVRFKPFKMADDIQRKAYLFQLNQAGKVSDTTLLADVDLDQAREDEIMERETTTRMKATEKQQLAQAELAGKQQAVMMKQTAKAQQDMQQAMLAPDAAGEPGGPDDAAGQSAPGGQGGAPLPPALQDPMGSQLNTGQKQQPQQAGQGQPQAGGGAVDLISIATGIAAQIGQMDPAGQQQALQQVRKQSPELADLVLNFLMGMGGGQQPHQMGGAAGAAASQVNPLPLPEARAPRRTAQTV